jgi:hypothetical protein
VATLYHDVGTGLWRRAGAVDRRRSATTLRGGCREGYSHEVYTLYTALSKSSALDGPSVAPTVGSQAAPKSAGARCRNSVYTLELNEKWSIASELQSGQQG